ncbi:VPS72 protein, partial [Syrrhaptes paradoxus]|nr:VPS72 protein [Syrrhaptes paradoxus]
MSLAEGRAPRRTAGNRLSGLLEAEEEDEFYQTTYGGFTEVRDRAGGGTLQLGHRRVSAALGRTAPRVAPVLPKPRLEGVFLRPHVLCPVPQEPLKSLRPKKTDVPSGSSQKPREVKSVPLELQDDAGDSRKHMRQSTTEHTRQTFLRIQERQVQSKRKKGGPNYDRPLTQEELLEEAKITEEINLRSLENYERLEADKKKQVQKKRKCVGPVIRYWSVTMPLVPEPGKEENVDVEG